MIKFYTKHDRPEKKFKELKDNSFVETAGYISGQQQIENILMAGERLSEYRKEAYDFGVDESVPDNYIDPTRNPNVDMVDIDNLQKGVIDQITTQKQKDAAAEQEKLVEQEALERENLKEELRNELLEENA